MSTGRLSAYGSVTLTEQLSACAADSDKINDPLTTATADPNQISTCQNRKLCLIPAPSMSGWPPWPLISAEYYLTKALVIARLGSLGQRCHPLSGGLVSTDYLA